MSNYIIINPDAIPSLVAIAFISFLVYGVLIGYELEQRNKYKD